MPRAVEEDEGELVESEPKWRDNTEDALESIIIEPRMTFGEKRDVFCPSRDTHTT